MGMDNGGGLPAFREEAKKCVLLCANCHGEVEAGLVEAACPGHLRDLRSQAPSCLS